MNYWYSPSARGFYPQKGPHKFKPADAVSVTEAEHTKLFPKDGPQHEIVAGPKGKPQWRIDALEDRVAACIKAVKIEAGGRIAAILPLSTQMNLVRDGRLDDPRFAIVDAIRAASNLIEHDIASSEEPEAVPIADHPLWPEGI